MKNKLNFPGLLNVRDLGGYATVDGAETRWKSLLRSDELGRLRPEGAEALWEYGVRTVIDLRCCDEAESRPALAATEAKRLGYTRIPLMGEDHQRWAAERTDKTKEMWNCALLDYSDHQIHLVLRAIAGAPQGAVLFHCVSGKDRTGLVAALLLALADVQPELIAYDYAVTTENLRDAYLDADRGDQRKAILEQVRCPVEQIHNTLAYVQQRGGITGYLRSTGLSDAEITNLRGRLR